MEAWYCQEEKEEALYEITHATTLQYAKNQNKEGYSYYFAFVFSTHFVFLLTFNYDIQSL